MDMELCETMPSAKIEEKPNHVGVMWLRQKSPLKTGIAHSVEISEALANKDKPNMKQVFKVPCCHFLHLRRVLRKVLNGVVTEAEYLTIAVLDDKEVVNWSKQVILLSVKLAENVPFQAIKDSKEMGKNCLPDAKFKLVE